MLGTLKRRVCRRRGISGFPALNVRPHGNLGVFLVSCPLSVACLQNLGGGVRSFFSYCFLLCVSSGLAGFASCTYTRHLRGSRCLLLLRIPALPAAAYNVLGCWEVVIVWPWSGWTSVMGILPHSGRGSTSLCYFGEAFRSVLPS